MKAKTLRELRLEKNLTLSGLQSLTGIQSRFLSLYENNKAEPPEEHKQLLCQALGCKMEEVLFPKIILVRGVE